jgi:23S rRNA-/tRNA-specific pseudouridylate synthase
MRVATAETEEMQQKLLEQQQSHDLNAEETKRNSRFLRMVGKGAKSSLTTYRILSYEYLDDQNIDNDGNLSIRRLPVTRLELHPITGRTHQLRVHCAAMGHPIVGDSIYGFRGEGAPHGGLSSSSEDISSDAINLQQNIYNLWLKRHTKRSESVDAKEECMLCLHAQQLNVFHPYTNVPMSFSSRSPF